MLRSEIGPTLALVVSLAALAACDGHAPPAKPGDPARMCADLADCAEGEYCLHNLCTAGPTPGDGAEARASLRATPGELDFGLVAAGARRRLSVVLENDGERVVVLSKVEIEPFAAPFRVEPMGTGPFWIRPGRSRALFVSFEPQADEGGPTTAELVIASEAPTLRLALSGQ